MIVLRSSPVSEILIPECPALTAPERARMGQLRMPADQRLYAAGRTLARSTIAPILETRPAELVFTQACHLCGHPTHGKPRLPGTPIDFSISHAADRVLVGICTYGHIGVDLERTHRNIDAIAPRILHSTEPVVFGNDLLRTWVRKEAILKAHGTGLAIPMTSLNLNDLDPDIVLADLPIHPQYIAAYAWAPY